MSFNDTNGYVVIIGRLALSVEITSVHEGRAEVIYEMHSGARSLRLHQGVSYQDTPTPAELLAEWMVTVGTAMDCPSAVKGWQVPAWVGAYTTGELLRAHGQSLADLTHRLP